MKISIKNITVEDTYPIRSQLLRPGLPLTSCQFEQDTHPKTGHWGAWLEGELVGIVSAMPTPCPDFESLDAFQFRAMAVLPNHQRKGIATRLLLTAEKQLMAMYQPDLFWLNSRMNAQKLYASLTYQTIGDVFEIPTVGPHVRFYKKTCLI